MAINREQIKSWFSKGKYPLASHFAGWIDSFWHKDDSIPISAINNLNTLLNQKMDAKSLDSKQDVESEELMTEAKTIVDAINELYLSRGSIEAEKVSCNVGNYSNVENALKGVLSALIDRDYTLDFNISCEVLQVYNLISPISIQSFKSNNVSRILLSYGDVYQMEVTEDILPLTIPQGTLLTWEIERETELQLSAVGVKYQILN